MKTLPIRKAKAVKPADLDHAVETYLEEGAHLGICKHGSKLPASRNGSNAQKRPIRFPGIVLHARMLGVHRTSLYLALTYQRPGRSLRSRYRELTGRHV